MRIHRKESRKNKVVRKTKPKVKKLSSLRKRIPRLPSHGTFTIKASNDTREGDLVTVSTDAIKQVDHGVTDIIYCINCYLNRISVTGDPMAKTESVAQFIYDGQSLCYKCAISWQQKKRVQRIEKAKVESLKQMTDFNAYQQSINDNM